MIIGGDDTPAPPASDLRSSTTPVCVTTTRLNKGGERSWRVDVVRLVVTAMKWVGRCKSGNKPDTHYCPVGGGRIIKHPPHFKTPVKGTALASVTLVRCLQGCIIACKSTYRGVHMGIVLITHHFFERHFAIGFQKKILMSFAKKIFRPMAELP